MHVRILREQCCGNAECAEIAPGAFGIDSKRKAVVLDSAGDDDATLMAAAEACPCAAIVIEDDEGNQVFP